MRKTFCSLVIVSLFIMLSTYSLVHAKEFPRFKGELCWSFTGPGIMNLWVQDIGGGHYIVSGKITINGIIQNILHGNAEIDGSNIYMTLVNSGKNSQAMWTGINHAILDGSTLSGTFEAIGNDRSYSEVPIQIGGIFIDSDTQYSSGSLTLISCPR